MYFSVFHFFFLHKGMWLVNEKKRQLRQYGEYLERQGGGRRGNWDRNWGDRREQGAERALKEIQDAERAVKEIREGNPYVREAAVVEQTIAYCKGLLPAGKGAGQGADPANK